MKENTTRIILFGLLAFANVSAQPSQTGGFDGTIQDDKGKPLANAFVVASGLGISTGNPRSFSSTTAQNGTFALTGMPPDNYRACIQSRGNNLLDPCQWSPNPPTAAVTGGQTTHLGTIQLQKGHSLQVHVIDDSGDLAKNSNKTPGASLQMGVTNSAGLFQPLRTKGKDTKNWFFELIVPFDTQLQLTVQSAFYMLTDQNGNGVDKKAGASLPIQVPSGTNAPTTIIYHVTGVTH